MFVKSVFSVLLVCVLLSACSGQNGPVLITSGAKLDKAKCSKIEKDMINAYTAVAAQEGVTRKIKKTNKYKTMLKEDRPRLMEIMDKRKREKIDPFIYKYRKLHARFKTGCGKPSKRLADLKVSYPSQYLR